MPKYFFLISVSKHLQYMLLPQCKRPLFTSIPNNWKIQFCTSRSSAFSKGDGIVTVFELKNNMDLDEGLTTTDSKKKCFLWNVTQGLWIGGLLWTMWWIFEFHKRQEISPAEWLLASEEGFCSMEWVN